MSCSCTRYLLGTVPRLKKCPHSAGAPAPSAGGDIRQGTEKLLGCTSRLWHILLDFLEGGSGSRGEVGGLMPFCPSSAREGVLPWKGCLCKQGSFLPDSSSGRSPHRCPLLAWMMVADGGQDSVAGGDKPGYEVGVGCLEWLLID